VLEPEADEMGRTPPRPPEPEIAPDAELAPDTPGRTPEPEAVGTALMAEPEADAEIGTTPAPVPVGRAVPEAEAEPMEVRPGSVASGASGLGMSAVMCGEKTSEAGTGTHTSDSTPVGAAPLQDQRVRAGR
jgi:hypothetical protein